MTKSLYAIALCAAAVVPAFASAKTIEEEIEQSQMITEIQILSDAEVYYEEHGLKHPLANVESFATDYEAVRDSASSVLRLFPDDTYALNCRSIAQSHLGNYEESAKDALKALCRDETDGTSSVMLYYLAGVDPDLVIRCMEPYTAVYIANPKPKEADGCIPLYLHVLAQTYDVKDDMAMACKIMRLALDSNKWSIDNIVYMSTLLMRSGNADKAVKLLKPQINDDDTYFDSMMYNYTLALRDTGKSKEAYRLINRCIGTDGDDESDYDYERLQLAAMLASNGDFENAIALFDAVIANREMFADEYTDEAPDNIRNDALIRRGICEILTGSPELGRTDIKQVLDSSLAQSSPTGWEATCYAYLGDKDKALEWMKKYGRVHPSNNASIYSILGDHETALRYLKEAFDTHTASPAEIDHDINFTKTRELPAYRQLVKEYKPLKLK